MAAIYSILVQCRNLSGPNIKAENWLDVKVAEFESSYEISLDIPCRDDGSDFTIDGLYPDQQFIMYKVLLAIREFLYCDDPSTFVPLRCTINGPAGTGKTVLIQTIVATMRKIFQRNDVIKVVAPTGTAACNVGGETLHHMGGVPVSNREYARNSMTTKRKDRLLRNFRHLLCLVIDERSLVTSALLGTTDQIMRETMFGDGQLGNEPFGGLPVLILVGDDYQLSGTYEGGIQSILNRTTKGPMTTQGRAAFKLCAETVFNLTVNRRVSDEKQADKDLMNRVRIGDNIPDDDIDRLMQLRLDHVAKEHGMDYVQSIRDRAMYLFFKNDKRIRHNLEMVSQKSSADNPVAFIPTRSTGGRYGKGIRSHFNDTDIPATSILFRGAKVCLEGHNICPLWGLHNGAHGIVHEIVFDKGKNPNKGDMPTFVVVEFPMYTGPAWDLDNPKVSYHRWLLMKWLRYHP